MSLDRSGGLGLYFIDIFSCVLFCLTLALVGARFGRETTLPITLPQVEKADRGIGDLPETTLTLREGEIYWQDEAVEESELEARLVAEAPPAVVLRMEASVFTRALAAARAAGVSDIRVAYEIVGPGGER